MDDILSYLMDNFGYVSLYSGLLCTAGYYTYKRLKEREISKRDKFAEIMKRTLNKNEVPGLTVRSLREIKNTYTLEKLL